MRCKLEVIGTGVDIAKFPSRKGGGVDEVPFVWISGVDTDYLDQMIKVKIFRPKKLEALRQLAQKGSQLQIKFRTLKHDDRFEHCTVISANEDDVQPFVQAETQPRKSNGVEQQPATMALAA